MFVVIIVAVLPLPFYTTQCLLWIQTFNRKTDKADSGFFLDSRKSGSKSGLEEIGFY